jgi:predicted permease
MRLSCPHAAGSRYPHVAIKIVASKPAGPPTEIILSASNTTRMDLRYALRTLRATPGFTLVVIVTLALGIGANTAIFSLTDQVLLRRLPVKSPDELVLFENPGAFAGRQFNDNTFSFPMYRDFRDSNTVFSGIAARFPTPLTLLDGDHGGAAERVNGELISGNYFDVLGVRAVVGRTLTPDDDRVPGAHPVAVLSHNYWMRRFGGDASVLNRVVTVNGHPFTIVGVAEPGFTGIAVGESPDIMVPIMMKAEMTPTWNDLDNRRSRWLTLVARLKPGVDMQRAEASMNVLYRQINEQEVKLSEGFTPSFKERFVSKHLFLRPGQKGRSELRAQFSTPILVLTGMVGLVLLIACANVANLLLARGAARQKEVAIRLALGAGRAAIVRQRLVESLLLAGAGAGVGLLLAWWTGGLLLNTLPFEGAARTLSAAPDARVVAFACGAALCTAVLFGLAPALQSTRPALTSTLKDESGSVVGGTGHARFRKGLVVAQVGLSVLLLAGAALFARSLYNLRALNPGFTPSQLLGFSIDPSLSGYSRERSLAYFQQLQEEMRTVPDVQSSAVSAIPLMTDSRWSSTVRVEGYTPKEGENMSPYVNAIGPGYFATMNQALIAGRDFTVKDVAGAPKVAIINETMAKYFFRDDNPIGHRIGWRRTNTVDIEIVGVVKDTKMFTLRDKPLRVVYTPLMQEDEISAATMYVRARGDAVTVAAAVRQAALRVDPTLPIFDMKTMTRTVDESLFVERMVAALSVAFGGLATLLAAIGLYGVMSYSVARRTREIGIRMALGAERTSVLWLVLREVASMVLIGVAVGVPLAVALGRVVQGQLFDLSAQDPAALLAAASILALVAIVAGYLPARRATRVDPMLALRYE